MYKKMILIVGSLVFLTSSFCAAEQKRQKAPRPSPDHEMRIGILQPNPQGKKAYYEKWLKAVKELGYEDVRIVNTRELKLWHDHFILMRKSAIAARAYSDIPEIPLMKINTLIIPDTWMHESVAKAIERFVENGGRVIATRRAGYLDGQFFLTKTLRTGKYNINIPIIYPHYMEDNPNHDRDVIKWALENGADGFAVFEFSSCFAHPGPWSKNAWKWFTNFSPDDVNPGLKQVFLKSDSWKKKDMPGLWGTPDFIKELFIHRYHRPRDHELYIPEELIANAKAIGANMVKFAPFHTFYTKQPLLYPSKLPTKSAELAPMTDYFPRILAASKKANIRVGVCFKSHIIGWEKESSGAIVRADGSEYTGRYCPLRSPKAVEFQARVMEEFAAMYPEVIVYAFDEPHMERGCFCPECKKLFKQRYAKDLDKKTYESPEFYEFREYVFTEYYCKPLMKAINKANPYARIGIATWSEYEGSGINAQRLSDAGMSVWNPEISKNFYYAEGMVYQPESSPFYFNTEHMGSHRVNWFWFDKLDIEKKNSPFLSSVNLKLPSKFKGVKLDLFNGATVHAWMENKDGNKYPAIVTANAGRTVYYSLDPFIDKLPEETAKTLIKNALDWLKGHPFLIEH
jgi:hypothetical protein